MCAIIKISIQGDYMAVIKQVNFGRTYNDGNFESTRIDVFCDVEPGDNHTEVFEDLMQEVYELRLKQLNGEHAPHKGRK